MTHALADVIDRAWERRDTLSTDTMGEVREVVDAAIELLDKGEARVASREADGSWTVHQWLKKAVLLPLAFRRKDRSTASFRAGRDRAPGGTRSRPSSKAGARLISRRRVSGLCRPARCGGARLLRDMPC